LELAHPFGNPATLGSQSDLRGPIGFASPPYGGFAFVEDVAGHIQFPSAALGRTLPSAAGIRNRLQQNLD